MQDWKMQETTLYGTSVVNQIARLAILSKCRKRAAEEEVPLRQIFDDVCRTAGTSAQEVAFAEVESSMYMYSTHGDAKSAAQSAGSVRQSLRVAGQVVVLPRTSD